MPSGTDCSRSHSSVFSPWPREGTGSRCLGVSLWLLFHLAGRLSLQLRMGRIGATVQPMNGGLWKTRSTHQCAGIASSLACSQAFPAAPKGEVFPRTVQQHIGSVSYKRPGQDQICMAAGCNKRTPHMGSPLPGQPSGQIYLSKCRIAWQTPFPIKNLHRESDASIQMWKRHRPTAPPTLVLLGRDIS